MRLVLLIVGLLMACGPAVASDPVRPAHRRMPTEFTSADGLPRSGVNDILQARSGYLWIATFGGLSRFDGLSFATFRDVPDDASPDRQDEHEGPSSDRILSLYEDDRERLWVGTQDAGLSVYEDGTFRYLPMCGGTCQVDSILQADDHAVWVASSVGLYRIPPDGYRAVLFEPSGARGYGHLASDGDGRIYADGFAGLGVVDGQRLRPIPLPGGDSRVTILRRDGETLLVGTERRLYRYRVADGQWIPLAVEQPAYASRDVDGHWWVSQGNRSLLREDDAGAWHAVPEALGIGITSLSHDDSGNLWIGTASKGLLRFREPLFGHLAAPQLGTDMAGRAVVGDGHGGLWFGLSCAALRHWQYDGSMQALPLESGVDNNCVSSLLRDTAGILWAGASSTLFRIDGGKSMRIAEWPGVQSVNVWQTGEGRYLVSAGLSTHAFDIDAAGRVVHRRRLGALEGMRINYVVPAARGGYWFVGDQGVRRLVGDEVVERWTPREGLSSRFARALYEDADGLWVGTYGGGLDRIRNGQVQHYDSSNGLSDDTVSCILADDRGRLWLGGNEGVTLLTAPGRAGARIESVAYGANDGLVPSEINGGNTSACHRDARGRLWFSLVQGFAVVDPAAVPDVEPPLLRPYIESAGVSGHVRRTSGPVLTLRPFARNLEIHYTAINLSRPRETRFRFRLSGFDRDWVEAGHNRSIIYPSIPWGEHLFEVQARTAGGAWSPVSAKLQIVHPQPWYLRPWIWTLATLMGLLVLVGGTQMEKGGERSRGNGAARWNPRTG